MELRALHSPDDAELHVLEGNWKALQTCGVLWNIYQPMRH